MEATLSEGQITACLEFAKELLKESESMMKKILWSDEREIEPSGQKSKHYVWQTPGTARPLVNNIMPRGCV